MFLGKLKQDFKIDNGKTTYVEIQNSAKSVPPIEIRAKEYFGFSLGHSNGKDITQLWILAEDVALLNNKTFANYILKDEKCGTRYPSNNNLMFVSLQKLSNEDCEAGELARYLLGQESNPKHDNVKEIKSTLDKGFEVFARDKEVIEHMTILEKRELEGMKKGIEKGIEKMLRKAIELNMPTHYLAEMAQDAGISQEQLQLLIDEVKNRHNLATA